MPTNTIDDKLKLSETLGFAMRAMKKRLLSLNALSTVYEKVALKGTDKVLVPYYPRSSGSVKTRTEGQDYFELATDTSTLAKEITINKSKLVGISFTAETVSRQPAFDPRMHGELKGEELADKVLSDIFSVIRASKYTADTIAPVTAANFDETEVADLMQKATEQSWRESGRGLLLTPAYAANMLKQGQIIDASKRGDGGESFRKGIIGDVLGFDVWSSAGVPTNNTPAVACTAEADDDIVTCAAHEFTDGDRIIFPTLTGGAGLTAASVFYFVRDATLNGFKVTATVGGGAINITTDATAGTVRKAEQLGGVATLPGAILTGFAPVPPTAAMMSDIYDYQILTDKETGLVLEYLHLAEGNKKREGQFIEVHYGYAEGDTDALMRITTPLA